MSVRMRRGPNAYRKQLALRQHPALVGVGPEAKWSADESFSLVRPSHRSALALFGNECLESGKSSSVTNVLRPFGTTLGFVNESDSFNEVLRTRKPVLGGLGPFLHLHASRDLINLRYFRLFTRCLQIGVLCTLMCAVSWWRVRKNLSAADPYAVLLSV